MTSKQSTFPQGVINEHLATHPTDHLYLLIDGALNEDLLSRTRAIGFNEPHSLYADFPEGLHQAETPLLFQVSTSKTGLAQGENLLESLVADSAMLVWSPHAAHTLIDHLAWFATVEIEGKRHLLRFHDPLLWGAFIRTLDQRTQAQLLQPLSAVWLMDLDGHWWRSLGPGSETPLLSGSQVWSSEQQQQFNRRLQPYQLLRQLSAEHEERLRNPWVPWLKRLDTWIDTARQAGTKTVAEDKLFCVVALFTHEQFFKHEQVARELMAIGDRHANFAEAIAAIPDLVWSQLEAAQGG